MLIIPSGLESLDFFISASLGNVAGVKYNPQYFHFFPVTSECNHFYAKL